MIVPEVEQELEQWAAILASVLSPSAAAQILRNIADTIEALQPVQQ